MDVVRICLLELLQVGFVDGDDDVVVDDELLRLVEDLDEWDKFPWGSYVWRRTYESLSDDMKTRLRYDPKCERPPKYSLRGFMFAFKIWILEVLPCCKLFHKKDETFPVPRGIAWTQKKVYDWSICVKFDKKSMEVKYRPRDMKVTHFESQRPWYQDTIRFLEVDSLLAKFESRFNIVESMQEGSRFDYVKCRQQRRFGNIGELLEVLWKKAYPNYNMYDLEMTEEEIAQFMFDDQQPQPIISTEQAFVSKKETDFIEQQSLLTIQELLKKPGDQWTADEIGRILQSDDDLRVILQSCVDDNDDDELMMEADGGATSHKVILSSPNHIRAPVFETTAREFYRRGIDNGNPVDHYSFVTGYPHGLNLEFWGRLLNVSGNGWLETEHIDIWSNIVASSPNKDERCGILPVDFHYILHDCDRIYALANGSEGPCPPWWTLDRVLFPLNQCSLHWMLAELDLTSWNVRIYDSKFSYDQMETTSRMTFLHGIHDNLQQLIPMFLDKLNYWSNASVERVDNLQMNLQYFGIESPQQTDSSSCGVYVCHFVEKLAHRQPVHIQCAGKVFEVSYREYIAETIYATRCG